MTNESKIIDLVQKRNELDQVNTSQQIKIMDLEAQTDLLLDNVHDLENELELERNTNRKIIKGKNIEIDELKADLSKAKKAKDDAFNNSELKRVQKELNDALVKIKRLEFSLDKAEDKIGFLAHNLAQVAIQLEQVGAMMKPETPLAVRNKKQIESTVKKVKRIEYHQGETVGKIIKNGGKK